MEEKKQIENKRKPGKAERQSFKKNIRSCTNTIERLDKTLKRQRENTKNREKMQGNYKN